MDEESAREHWDADYRKKGRLYGGSSRQLPDFPPGSRVLDLGCGEGRSIPAMVASGWDVVAADYSPHAISLAREATGNDGSGRVSFVLVDAGSLPFPDACFDAVTAVHVMGHSREGGRRHIAGEICRVAKPGAQIFFVVFGRNDFRYGSGREAEPGTYVRGTGILTHYFTEEETANLFPECTPDSVKREEWLLRIRGKAYLRSEIRAVFTKNR